MKNLFQPARLGPLVLRNRIMRAATNEHLSQPDGGLTSAWAESLALLARYEVGLVVTGHLTVDRGQRAAEGQPALDDQSDSTLLRQAAQGVHAHGGVLLAQLSHSGPKALQALNGTGVVQPDDMTIEEIDGLVERFCRGAVLCQQAGFDGVQIHCAHGYLLSTFLDRRHNHRDDAYGGDLTGRCTLPLRIIRAVRAACGDHFAILVKVDSDGCGELQELLLLLQRAGADGAEMSGLDFNMRRGEKRPFYLDALVQACKGVELPMVLTGGIFCRETAQAALDAGASLVGLSRSLICQPDFVLRMRGGEVSACCACLQCYSIFRRRPVRCVQHTKPIEQLRLTYHV